MYNTCMYMDTIYGVQVARSAETGTVKCCVIAASADVDTLKVVVY